MRLSLVTHRVVALMRSYCSRGRHVILLLVLATSSVVAPRTGTADCPENCIDHYGRVPLCSTAASAETTYYQRGLRDCGSDGSYDLQSGLLSASIGCGFAAGTMTVTVADDFEINGPAGGDPSTLVVEMILSADGTPGRTSISASIQEETTTKQAILSPAEPRDTILTLQVSHVPGEAFRLEFELEAGNGGEAGVSAVARYRFRELPSGWTVSSCQGFLGDYPTQVLRQSWGRLKTMYR